MSYIPFDRLPDAARLWIFASNKELPAAEADALLREMQSFVHTWTAHGAPVTGSCEMRYNRFLMIAADESSMPSGCSTDEMMRRVRILGETYGVEFLGMPRVEYRANGSVQSIGRTEFAELAKSAAVNDATIVFDNTLTKLSDLRMGKWEVPAANAWHSKAFEFAT